LTQLGNRERASKLLLLAENFSNLKYTLIEGKKIDILKIDPPVTPSLILGLTEEQRINKFNEIIESYNSCFETHK